MRQIRLLLALAVLLVGSPVSAQNTDSRVDWEVGGGYTWALSEVKDFLGNGFNFNVGATYKPTPLLGIEGLYSYNGLGSKDFSLPVSVIPGGPGVLRPFTADYNMQYGTASLVVNSPMAARIRPYGLTGVGVYYRPVTVTTPSVGFVPGFCSPFWYVCEPGGFVATDRVVGDRSSWDFGMVFGGGVNFRVTDEANLYLEIRYHYIWGPEINPGGVATLNGTNSIHANGKFLPLTLGIRF